MAEAAAATAAVEAVQVEEKQEGDQEQVEEEVEEKEEGVKEIVTSAVAGSSAMAVSEQEEECSVCLNAIESDDANNPAGPPLVCGHRYHAFCLNFWVEKCRSKCIEATCPHCRAPVQEVESGEAGFFRGEKKGKK